MISRAARYWPWFALLWAAAVTIRYLGAVSKALANPFNPGNDEFWARLWLAVGAGFLCVLWGNSRSFFFKVLAGVLLSLAGGALILSGSLGASLIALWLLVWIFVTGDLLVRRLGVATTDDLCDRIVIALPVGFTALAIVALTLAVFGYFNAIAAWSFLVVTSLLGARRAISVASECFAEGRRTWHLIVQSSRLARFLVITAGWMFLLNLTWSVAPEIQYDSLNVRLGVPKIYVNEGRFVDLSYMFHSYFVRIMEWVYGFCIALHSEKVAQLVSAAVAVAAAVAVYSLGRALFSANVGLWAAVFFYTAPLASWVAGTTYTDLAVALFTSALALSAIYYQRTRSSYWLAVSGMLAAAGLSVKLTAAPVVMAVSGALLWLVVRDSSISWRARIRSLDLPVALAVLVAWPWHLLTFVLTGNPIFPMMNDVFRSPKWEFVNTAFNIGDFGVGTSIGALLRLPFRLTLDTARFGEALPRGSVGPLLILFIPLGLLLVTRKEKGIRIFVAITAISFSLWAVVFQYGRYYLAVLPGIAVIAIAGLYEGLPARISRFVAPGLLVVLLLSQGVVTPIQYWNIPERYPTEVAFGKEDRHAFLHRSLGGYGAAEHLNGVVPPGGRVLTIGCENLRLYVTAPLESLALALSDSPLRLVTDLKDDNLSKALSDLGYTHLLLSRSDVENPAPYYTYAAREFLREHAVLEYSEESALVFRLKR